MPSAQGIRLSQFLTRHRHKKHVVPFLDIYGYNLDVPSTEKTLCKIDSLKKEIQRLRPIRADLIPLLREKLRIEWIFHSNAIEGNSLTLGETTFFLREGLTSEGKPLKDFLEAKNHVEALDGLEDIVAKKRPITESLIKELHAVLLREIRFTEARGSNGRRIKKPLHPGQYKIRPNHVLTLSGKIHRYTDPLHVKDEMEELVRWSYQAIHPVKKAAEFHYRFVAIHPFDDGNGRLARILMNLILIKDGYPPCIIRNEQRKKYLSSLEIADFKKDITPFIDFVMQELLVTMQTVYDVLTGQETMILEEKQNLNRIEREALVLKFLKDKPKSIQQIQLLLPEIKRPTLKSDLQRLVKSRKILKKGVRKGTLYFKPRYCI